MNAGARRVAAVAAGAAIAAVVARKIVDVRRAGDLAGSVVAVFGGSRGLGLALAREYGRRGAVVAIGARDPDELRRAADDLARRGIAATSVPCDVRERTSVERSIRTIVDRHHRLDVVVNVAGTIAVGPMEAMRDEDYRDAMETHFWGPHFVTSAALPYLRASRGRVVNIASIGGLLSIPHLLPYSASKFALVGYSLGVRQELVRSGVSVTTVCPGLMRTGSPRNATFKGRHRSEYAWFDGMATSPLTSISASSAARQIVEASLARRNLVVLSAQAQMLALAARALPNLVGAVAGFASRVLPRWNGDATSARGSESEGALTRSPLAALGHAAERDLNEL